MPSARVAAFMLSVIWCGLLYLSSVLVLAPMNTGNFKPKANSQVKDSPRELIGWDNFVKDAMDRRSMEIAGPLAVQCGRVGIWGNPQRATDCVLRANKEGKEFRVRYDLLGIDSSVAAGLVRSPNGSVYGIEFDGDPQGGGGTHQLRQRVGVFPCPRPVVLRVTAAGRVTCFGPAPGGRGNIMSPTFAAY